MAGGATALLVTFAFVSANAIWYQPHAHQSPLMATRPDQPISVPSRPPDEPDTRTAAIERQPNAHERDGEVGAIIRREDRQPTSAPRTDGDAVVVKVQKVMADLGLYEGEIDGLAGPMTRSAIEAYQGRIGLEATGRIDEVLLEKLGLAGEPAVPAPPPSPPGRGQTDQLQTASLDARPAADEQLMRIQAGLRAFGNDGIEIDGVMGPRTQAAIREFQSLFGLPVTGEPDGKLYAKMRDIGLMD
jgi:peptidoglycan hydrolase-like protein with peptidoglycan-binding domain